ncbi:NPP1-domain-containing protein [Colletotrichum falcatum]|nr:NPP1-domain-containing protein [Colletotrichum falcatum]
MFSKAFLAYTALSYGVAASVLPRGDNPNGHKFIDHDAVKPLQQKASADLGDLELRFNPHLYVDGGCDPYPAVDADGNLGGGLKPTGGGRSGCDKGGDGQVYVRVGQTSQGRRAVMYSYYMPKVRWAQGDNNGHRHYWASVVIWVNRWGCDTTDVSSVWPVGISYTTDHLLWGMANAKDVSFKSSETGTMMPTQPQMQLRDRAMSAFTGADGPPVKQRTLISYDALPDAARQALIDVKYEKTEVPFIDANFQNNLDAAYQTGIFGGLTTSNDCISTGSDTHPNPTYPDEPTYSGEPDPTYPDEPTYSGEPDPTDPDAPAPATSGTATTPEDPTDPDTPAPATSGTATDPEDPTDPDAPAPATSGTATAPEDPTDPDTPAPATSGAATDPTDPEDS